jgi:hypothetical protein
VRPPIFIVPIRKVVGIRISVIEKSALLNAETTRILTATALIKSQGPLPEKTFVHLYRLPDVLALLFRREKLIVHPPISVRCHLVAAS